MPHREESKLTIKQLHPTFAAEVRGVDFSTDIPQDVFNEIYQAITKVRSTNIGNLRATDIVRSTAY